MICDFFAELFLGLEARAHRVDAYLARHRGEMAFAADCECRALECERKLDVMKLKRRPA